MANPSTDTGWGGPQTKPLTVMLAVVVAVTIWSAIDPYDYATWFFELFIGAGGIIALVVLRHRFPVSTLLLAVVLGKLMYAQAVRAITAPAAMVDGRINLILPRTPSIFEII